MITASFICMHVEVLLLVSTLTPNLYASLGMFRVCVCVCVCVSVCVRICVCAYMWT